MSCRSTLILIARRTLASPSSRRVPLTLTTATSNRFFAAATSPGLPESIKRVGEASAFPNEYPGQNYAFNWSLNADGVTPLRKSAFRITKVLDLKIAGLEPHAKSPLKVNAAASKSVPEAGSDSLSFDAFDEVTQRTKDLLSLSESLYCPEGHVPGTRTGVRIITNSAALAPRLVAYLERAPRRDPKSQPITAYVLEGTEEEFAGFAIEEVEEENEDDGSMEAKSVAAVVIVGSNPDIKKIVAGLEQSAKGLAADEAERAAKAEKEA
jgi:hypothetical protein